VKASAVPQENWSLAHQEGIDDMGRDPLERLIPTHFQFLDREGGQIISVLSYQIEFLRYPFSPEGCSYRTKSGADQDPS